jgi:hypothetical protein
MAILVVGVAGRVPARIFERQRQALPAIGDAATWPSVSVMADMRKFLSQVTFCVWFRGIRYCRRSARVVERMLQRLFSGSFSDVRKPFESYV